MVDFAGEGFRTEAPEVPAMLLRKFETGATRDLDNGKLDFEAFLSPVVLEEFARYMHKHRKQSDGAMRDGDNWQKGIPMDVYMKSAWRHFFEWWREHRSGTGDAEMVEACCALMFNCMGYLHEHLKERRDER